MPNFTTHSPAAARRQSWRRALALSLCAWALPALAGAQAPVASAGLPPAQVAQGAQPAKIEWGAREGDPVWRKYLSGQPRAREAWAYSPANQRWIPLVIIQGGDLSVPRPTLYLLNGADGGEGTANWIVHTDVIDYYADKNVNVVIPMAGAFSYYVDWQSEGNSKLGGAQQWETFLVRELPQALEPELGANGKRALAGVSMSATSSLLLAEYNPGFYDAVGSFSGCAATSTTPAGILGALATLSAMSAGSPQEVLGSGSSTSSTQGDALALAEQLRGTELYISNASGLPGEEEMFSGSNVRYSLQSLLTLWLDGAVIEGVTNNCTHDLRAKLRDLGIPAKFKFRNTGTHTWRHWEQDLRDSWPTFAHAFGLEVRPEDLEPARQVPVSDPAAALADNSGDAGSGGSSFSS